MNKTTNSLTQEEYTAFIRTALEGFSYTDENGKAHKFRPSERLVMILQTEAVTFMRIGDVLNMTLNSIVKDGNAYRLNVTEQKTGKTRRFEVSKDLYTALREYAINRGIKRTERLFPVTERSVQKQIGIIADHLGMTNVSTHSFRKTAATTLYETSGYDIELVREMLQHSSTVTTQRYIARSSKMIKEASKRASDTFLIA